MPIRRELRPLYPRHWTELSRRVRFERAGGECERCGRPHGLDLRCLPDGRWFDPRLGTWRDRRGRPARWPDLEEMVRQHTTRVILAAAHLDHDPTNNRLRNLRSLCQRCHLTHDRAWHLLQRWITYRQRYARADFFLGPYRHGRSAALLLSEILAQISDRLAQEHGAEPRRGQAQQPWPRRIPCSERPAAMRGRAGGLVTRHAWYPSTKGTGRASSLIPCGRSRRFAVG